ncbi:hypothetical protein PYCC9005_003567 [Savitreella phatthalungensis]
MSEARPFPRMQRGLPQRRPIPGVNHVVAISSAKGGVGKSTVAVNTALAMAQRGLKIGLLDADIFGPSVPRLLDLDGQPELSAQGKLLPLSNYGIRAMSMGFLIDDGAPVVWRGLMVMKALQQLLHEVDWGTDLDVLVIDMPPGTGDVQLTITQQITLSGAIIVSTPQDISLIDAVRGISMFEKTDTKVIGLVQNMSRFVCPNCSHETHVFGEGGVEREARRRNIKLIGDIPLHAQLCADADAGKPTVVFDSQGVLSQSYHSLAAAIVQEIGLTV